MRWARVCAVFVPYVGARNDEILTAYITARTLMVVGVRSELFRSAAVTTAKSSDDGESGSGSGALSLEKLQR